MVHNDWPSKTIAEREAKNKALRLKKLKKRTIKEKDAEKVKTYPLFKAFHDKQK